MNAEELAAFPWEPDPLMFMFNDEIPGKTKMHTRILQMENWIKIDKTYPSQMELRRKLEAEKFDTIFVSSDAKSTQIAKQELLEEICKFLPERFPRLFERTTNDKGAKGVYNRATCEFISAEEDGLDDPLVRAGRLTQEDWCLLEWNEEHQAYTLEAGLVFFPNRWSLLEKFQKPIGVIHDPVKPFQKHLLSKVSNLFRVMKPSSPIWRGNWGLFDDLDGPLDLYTPDELRNEQNQPTKFEGDITGRKLTFRAEYQTLRKLPRTAAIVFSIRTYQRYLDEFKEFQTSDCLGLVKAIQTLDPDFHLYKGVEFWKDAAVEYLLSIVKEREDAPPSNPKKSSISPLYGFWGAVWAIAAAAVGVGLVVAFRSKG